jgi:tRNA pseudouridine38-40 synthase
MRPHDLTRLQLLIRFGYDGARFHGLQPQGPSIPTAGLALKERLTRAAGVPPSGLNFAARTDAGVHALSNLATCWFRGIADDRVPALLADLADARDDGLLFVHADRVPPTVHARGSARGKRYRYLIEDGVEDAPPERAQKRSFVWRIEPRIDADRMREAARHLVGTHDFSSLRANDCSAASPTKTLATVRVGGPFAVEGTGRRRFVVEVTGTAFLRKMMRNLVGLLVEVGTGWRSPDDVPRVLHAKRRDAAGIGAPPAGLVLVEVGCAWPPDGSGLVKELAGLSSTEADDDVSSPAD